MSRDGAGGGGGSVVAEPESVAGAAAVEDIIVVPEDAASPAKVKSLDVVPTFLRVLNSAQYVQMYFCMRKHKFTFVLDSHITGAKFNH